MIEIKATDIGCIVMAAILLIGWLCLFSALFYILTRCY